MDSDGLTLCEEPLYREKIWERDGVAVLKLSAALPQAEGSGRRAKRLNRWYTHFYRAYVRYCAHVLLRRAGERFDTARQNGTPWICPTAEITYRVSYRDENVLSLYLDAKENHLPPPLTIRRSDTWDRKAARLLPCDVFFPPKTPLRKRFFAAARDYFAVQRDCGAVFYRDCRLQYRLHFKKENYYLTEDAVVFYYQMYLLSPHLVCIPLARPHTDPQPCAAPFSGAK